MSIKYYILYKDEYNETLYKQDGSKLWFYHPYFKIRNKWISISKYHEHLTFKDLFSISEEDAFLFIMEKEKEADEFIEN